MNRRAPTVLIVLVVKDGARWLRECLRALSQQSHPRLGVVAVDNGSSDGSLEILTRALGGPRVIKLPGNRGLPAAVQAGLQVEGAAEADYILILHDDVALDHEAVSRMVEVAERIDGVGVVGPKVVDWEDPRILREVGLSTDRFGYPYSPLEQDEIDQGQYDRVREVLFVSSCAMLVSHRALARTGPPDERFSSYHEDLDFCWRARLAGFRVVMTPVARARHRGASQRGERLGAQATGRARYYAERASLATMLKNYGLLSLVWILPLYLAQGIAKLALWAMSRRFSEVLQVLAAWWWNFVHLPGTLIRRRRAQRVRAAPDRLIRRYMAPTTIRLRRWMETAGGLVIASGRAAEAGEEALAPEDEEIPTLRTRALALARAHPVTAAWVLFLLLAIVAYRHLYGSAPLEGGALAAFPQTPDTFFGELLSGVRTTGLGGTQPASPALGFLGVVSYVLGASTALAEKAFLVVLPPLAGIAFYRTSLRETGARTPSVVGAACYGLSALALWSFSEGRIPVLVLLAVLPVVVGRLGLAFGSAGVRSLRFIAGSAMVLAAGLAFFPGVAVALLVLLLVRLAVPERGEWRGRGTAAMALVAGTAAVLVLPLAIELAFGSGAGLAFSVTRPSFDSLVRLAPAGGPGSWSVSWFLPLAALVSFTLIAHRTRAAWRSLVAAVAALFLAWAAAAGYLPQALSNPVAYMAVAALSYCFLIADGLAEGIPELGRQAFGYRQLAIVAVGALLAGGIALQGMAAARGDWEVGSAKLPPAWPVVARAQPGHDFRVLWLGRLSGDPFLPPGGDPAGTLRAGGVSIRYGLTGRRGATALDTARSDQGPGYAALEDALANVLSGTTHHGGALLAPFGIRYVVAQTGDLPARAGRQLSSQIDLDLVPAGGLTIYRDAKALPGASITDARVVGGSSSSDVSGAVSLTGAHVTRLEPVLGGFAGAADPKRRGTAFVSDQFARGWRLEGSGQDAGPDRAFGWAMAFPLPRGSTEISIRYDDQWPRRIEIVLMALTWAAALWLTRRPAWT